jgi:hypothetical protein
MYEQITPLLSQKEHPVHTIIYIYRSAFLCLYMRMSIFMYTYIYVRMFSRASHSSALLSQEENPALYIR